jgi:hypothetical protein
MYVHLKGSACKPKQRLAVELQKGGTMPWHNGDYPPSYKNQPKKIRDMATEIANEVLARTGNEGEAIATGLKRARAHFAKKKKD